MGRITVRRPRKRRTQMKALVMAVAGPEKAYPVYEFANGKKRVERPRHNPFRDAIE